MIKHRLVLTWLALFVLPFLAACQGNVPANQPSLPVSTPGPGSPVAYNDITVTDLQAILKNKDFTFVNVHIPFEGNIAGTDLSIPYDEIEQNLTQLPADKAARIVLYCRSGRMSTIAAEKLAGLGYTNVVNVKGGMVAWEQAGLPVER